MIFQRWKNKKNIENKEEITVENFIPLNEYYSEMEMKKEYEKIEEKLDFFLSNKKEIKILTNVKIKGYNMDALIFSKKGIFILNVILGSGTLVGEKQDVFFDHYSTKIGSVKNIFAMISPVERKVLKSTKRINPYAELVVWKESLKNHKVLGKYDYNCIVVIDNDIFLSKTLYESQDCVRFLDLIEYINDCDVIYTKEEIDKIYSDFLLLKED